MEEVVIEPTGLILLADAKKKMAKAKRVILDFVKDHLIPHIIRKTTRKEMFDALVTLY